LSPTRGPTPRRRSLRGSVSAISLKLFNVQIFSVFEGGGERKILSLEGHSPLAPPPLTALDVYCGDASPPGREFIGGRLFIDSGRERKIVITRETKAGLVIAGPVITDILETVQGRDLKAAIPSLRATQPRDGDSRHRSYEGVGLKDTQ
jgi:hypothetical protein